MALTEATWSDSVRQRFEERYLAPLDPAVDSAINGMQEIAEVLERFAAIVPTGVRYCERPRPPAYAPRPYPDTGPSTHRNTPEPEVLRASARCCGRSFAWWPSAPRPRPRFRRTRTSSDRHGRRRIRQGAHRPWPKSSSGSTARRVADDEKQRRTIIDAAIEGEAKAKAEFAAGSRKIATMFDAAAIRPRATTHRAKAEAAATHDSGQKKAARQNAEKSKPIEDSAAMADSIREAPGLSRRRVQEVQARSRPAVRRRESYEKFADPGDELFTRLARMDQPLQLLEGLIIPKSMKGGREAWVFILLISLLVGLRHADLRATSPAWASAPWSGGVLAFLLRTWLVKLCKTQLERLYTPLTAITGRRRRA